MLELSADVSSPLVTERLRRLRAGLVDMRSVMESIGTELESRISGRFETETDPEGNSWAPWSPFTEATYPDDGNRRILDRYGDMRNSLSHTADATSVRVGFGAVASKAGDVYAIYHEFGTRYMPRRGLLTADPDRPELGAADEASVLELLEDWLNGLFD